MWHNDMFGRGSFLALSIGFQGEWTFAAEREQEKAASRPGAKQRVCKARKQFEVAAPKVLAPDRMFFRGRECRVQVLRVWHNSGVGYFKRPITCLKTLEFSGIFAVVDAENQKSFTIVDFYTRSVYRATKQELERHGYNSNRLLVHKRGGGG